jgi:hypothetical protein
MRVCARIGDGGASCAKSLLAEETVEAAVHGLGRQWEERRITGGWWTTLSGR